MMDWNGIDLVFVVLVVLEDLSNVVNEIVSLE